MPRWLFLILVTAVALSVLGSVLIVLRSPNSTPQLGGPVSAPAAPGMPPKPGGRPEEAPGGSSEGASGGSR
ncbi:hypothetical protein SAMN05216360_111105 [Methylobacterium phyllostachyos]|uniref:Uncharacterized protein n=1 Tax=Methylobacterium phyllostachyos TaxID=582672 RepID=A0A1H0EA20_9HYPH|nr:hypothetical protein [Methylobacterium phyllostachyos]SDN79158.1 hypothetical protein SAMN05216360_111105 [Methylobacterium phyllostachyos]